ncbi:MAG: patatin-like phospholipase family protein [Acidobacteria bacterium]|nr:patatin-like phospholipase family protein [Acidobacteriota bacterium]MDA1233910.1 patatin-like phospholipase family protein [Acidobacteriota bacterium]
MRALVLSGGASFGAYQAGVWKALEERAWEPDVIIGVSIGCVNAFALSRGASDDEMAHMWRDLPGEVGGVAHSTPSLWKHLRLFRDWLDAVVERFGERPPRYRMKAVLLEAPSLRFRMEDCLSDPRRYLEAACALPGVLPPVRADGKWLIDCGATRHLPIREALTLGATEIVAVDLLKHYPIPLARFARKKILSLRDFLHSERSEPSTEELAQVSLTVVAHDSPLGSIPDAFRWNPEHVERLLRLGYEDGLRTLSNTAPTEVVGQEY